MQPECKPDVPSGSSPIGPFAEFMRRRAEAGRTDEIRPIGYPPTVFIDAVKPKTHQGNLRLLPPALLAALACHRNWVTWKWTLKNGKWTKPPFIATDTDRHAKNNDATTWRRYDQARDAWQAGKADGIGFVLLNTDIAAFDIDKCRDVETGIIHPWASALVERANSYSEITPSGTGLRIIGKGSNRKLHTKVPVPNTQISVELYRNCERYITISGLAGDNTELNDIDQLLDIILQELTPLDQDVPNREKQEHVAEKLAPGEDESVLPEELLKLIRNGVEIGKRSDEFYRAVKWLKQLGWSLRNIVDLLECYPNGIAEKYVNRLEAETKRCYDKPDNSPRLPNAGIKPTIFFRSSQIPEISRRCEEILVNSGVGIYQRAGRLVRPVIEEADASHGRKTKVARLLDVSAIYLRNELDKCASWEKYNPRIRQWVPFGAPIDVANVILSQVGHWTFPRIAGVITTPTLRPNGSLLIKSGYDAETGLLLVEPPPMPAISDHPTREDALRAMALLEDLLVEFPFVDEVSKAVGLSALITPVVRGAFPVTPMHLPCAPAPGSGKSYLLDTVAAISIGRPMPVISAGQTEEELEKRLAASAMTGQPLISVDNIDGELRSVSLCQLIERQIVDLRILGKSEKIPVETRGLSMFGTGNNVAIYGDLTRRVLKASLDPEMEQPETRAFEGNPVATVLTDRGQYIAACLTICRAYTISGWSSKPTPLASFEGWSDMVRSALLWLGKADPVKSLDVARDEDPERNVLSEVMSAWADYVGLGEDHASTIADVVKLADSTDAGVLHTPLYPRLKDALLAVAAKNGKLDATALQYWLRGRKSRILAGCRFNNRKSKGHSAEWWLEQVGTAKVQQQRAQGTTSAPSQGADGTEQDAGMPQAQGTSRTLF